MGRGAGEGGDGEGGGLGGVGGGGGGGGEGWRHEPPTAHHDLVPMPSLAFFTSPPRAHGATTLSCLISLSAGIELIWFSPLATAASHALLPGLAASLSCSAAPRTMDKSKNMNTSLIAYIKLGSFKSCCPDRLLSTVVECPGCIALHFALSARTILTIHLTR